MRNPFGPRTSRRQRVTCQIIHLETAERGMVVDLVTLEPSVRGRAKVPAGTPVALAFDSRTADDGGWQPAALVMVLGGWQQAGAIVDLVVDDDSAGVRYELTSGSDRLVLLTEEPPADEPPAEEPPAGAT